MISMSQAVLHSKTQVWLSIATFIVMLIAVLTFWMKLWSIETEFEYVKIDIAEIKEKQVTMDQIKVTLDERYQKKK